MNKIFIFLLMIYSSCSFASKNKIENFERYSSCVAHASSELDVPVELINAILKTEGGKVGTVSRNKNGTYDLGLMQVNTRWLPIFKPYGITDKHLVWDPCTNIRVGTWILKREIVLSKNNFWKGVGNYHSRTPVYHNRYLSKVVNVIKKERQKKAENGTGQ